MTILYKKRAIFIHVHRTGGTNLSNLLNRHLEEELKIISQHGNFNSYPKDFLNRYWDYNVFGFIRNPWARMFSWYSLIHSSTPLPIRQEQERFTGFLINNLAIKDGSNSFNYNQLDYFPKQEDWQGKIQFYSFETYAQEVTKLFTSFGKHVGQTPKLNNNASSNYYPYYTATSQAMVAKKCALDIDYFNFSF